MIYRIDVRTAPATCGSDAGVDPLGQAIRHQIQEFGVNVGPVTTTRIFLLDTDAPRQDVQRIATELLADPIVEETQLVTGPIDNGNRSRIEIHLKPGVMDPVAASTQMAIRDMGIDVREVRTGGAYLIEGVIPQDQLRHIAERVLANGVIEAVHFHAYVPAEFERGREYQLKLKHVNIRDLSDQQLLKLSREGHLFLSLAEMKAIQDYYHRQGREPTDIELETLAQTWSEHCVHKTLKSAVEVCDASGKVLRRYDNLIKQTIFDSTMQLMQAGKGSFCLSVFKDNAGVIVFDDADAVCFKVETHNHPSAIEPYGGSATGVGGVIRDVLGTGLAAKPIANTDVFCVADPNFARDNALLPPLQSPTGDTQLPRGVIHPKRILQQIVAGVRDYGNRMGIPTVNGAVYFDNRYLGNPLVFCGCVGLIPRDKIEKQARPGDAIVLMGGRTGRDGIHGATFSSAELTDTHADEFSHAVQIGNAITEKKMTDVVLAARDRGLFTAITDCGAGGLSSAVGEMGQKIGASVQLERVPLKYAGLRYDEIWISEAQERMVLSVPPEKVDEVLRLAAGEDVEATVIGTFGTHDRELILSYNSTEVGRLSMDFLHDGIPMPTRRAIVKETADDSALPSPSSPYLLKAKAALKDRLLALLSHPNIASKHWIIRQYDHEVQGGSVIKPLIGDRQLGPSDAAVLRPKLNSVRGVALGCGLVPHIDDPYQMAIASIDEAIRNVVAVGADPERTAILDNFCWPSVDDEHTMGTLVRACEACRDAALAYRIPFISGKDSLHNQFTNQETGQVIRIPNTLLISAIAVLDDVRKCVTMDLKDGGDRLILVAPRGRALSDLATVHRTVASLIGTGLVRACHDVSDGGVLVAVAEMCIASRLGANVALTNLPGGIGPFDEQPGMYVLSVRPADVEKLTRQAGNGVALQVIGDASATPRLVASLSASDTCDVAIEELTRAWLGTLDW